MFENLTVHNSYAVKTTRVVNILLVQWSTSFLNGLETRKIFNNYYIWLPYLYGIKKNC